MGVIKWLLLLPFKILWFLIKLPFKILSCLSFRSIDGWGK